jgi:hypothetical protein
MDPIRDDIATEIAGLQAGSAIAQTAAPLKETFTWQIDPAA